MAFGTLESAEIRRKRLLYQCRHRGMKEVDLVLGLFAGNHLGQLSAAELDDLERLLAVPDDLLFRWLSGRSHVVEEHDTPLFARIRRSALGVRS